MNTRQLQYVLKVAEEKSFSAAAKKLYVAQPSLSEFIRKVEDELGYALFDRTAVPLKLTMAGEIYVDTARKILSLEQALGNQLRDMDENQYGKLSVGVSPYSGLPISVLKPFFDVYPNYKVDIQDSVGTAERLRMLEQGELDLCIQPIFEALGSKFVTEEIMSDHLVLAVPREYAFNERVCFRASDEASYPIIETGMLRLLNDKPFISINAGKRLRSSINRLFLQADIGPWIKAVCHSSGSCVDMVNAGLGFTIVQFAHVKYREALPNVKCYLIDQDSVRTKIAAIYMKSRYLSKAARTFIDIVKDI